MWCVGFTPPTTAMIYISLSGCLTEQFAQSFPTSFAYLFEEAITILV